jgi:uncharacterized protein (DUF2236 family)
MRPIAPAAQAWRPSVAWRVNAERLVIIGWGRAILLQLSHPLLAAGVFDHSGFRSTPWAAGVRLHHTIRAMLSLTFGDGAQRERTLNAIRQVHRRVNGILPSDVGTFRAGARYSAEDPALVLWVHATLVESCLLAYERLVEPLTPAERDAYCVEAAPVAVALNAREEEVPRTWREVREYLDRVYASGTTAVGAQARELADAVLWPRGRWLVAPAAWANRIITLGLLPPHVRDQYGFRWTARRARAFDGLTRLLRIVRRLTPDALATWKAART